MYTEEVAKLQKIIDDSSRIVFFGGAGVSTESNIPDFRSADGLYQQKYKYSPEQIVSHSFFMQNPEGFYEFYKNKMMFLDAEPNPAHRKLAEMEQKGKLMAVITQNIDGLHQLAGSKNVLELHGSIHRNYCMKCGKFYDAKYIDSRDGKKRSGQELFNGRINRNQKKDSENLHQYRQQKVSAGRRTIRKQHYSIQPHDIIVFNRQQFETFGCHCNGARAILLPQKKSVAIKKLSVHKYAGGYFKSDFT